MKRPFKIYETFGYRTKMYLKIFVILFRSNPIEVVEYCRNVWNENLMIKNTNKTKKKNEDSFLKKHKDNLDFIRRNECLKLNFILWAK